MQRFHHQRFQIQIRKLTTNDQAIIILKSEVPKGVKIKGISKRTVRLNRESISEALIPFHVIVSTNSGTYAQNGQQSQR